MKFAAWLALLLALAASGCSPQQPLVSVQEQGQGVGGTVYRVTVTQPERDELKLLVTTSQGAPQVSLRDVTGDGQTEVVLTYGAGSDSTALVVYQFRNQQWARILNLNGHPQLVSLPGSKAEAALSTFCCPSIGWGYRWDDAHGYTPIPGDQIVATFVAAQQPVDGMKPSPEMAVPQPILPVLPEVRPSP